MTAITVGDLEMAYWASGPEDGYPMILVHGWPDDASTWDEIVPTLNDAGYRTIVPTLRGFGGTRFLTETAPRTGNSGILALDLIGLMDELAIDHFIAVGHDWGSNAVEALAVGWPNRVAKIAMLSSPPRLGGMPTPSFQQAQRQWYHWFMATDRGAQAVRDDRRGFARLHWINWAPEGWFKDETFDRVAASWENPDWVEVTLHSYRARWEEAEPDSRSIWLEDKVKVTKSLSLPAMYFQGEKDGVNPPEVSTHVPDTFTSWFELVQLPNVGHFPQREAPIRVAENLVRLGTVT